MRILTAALLIVTLGLPVAASATDWNGVPLMDKNCSGKMKGTPDAHTTSCALKCAGSGYGVITADGTFVPFDKAGSEKALALLKGTKKADHLRVDVSGELKDGAIAVASLKFAD
jgi:hypothetical protein